MHSNVVNPFVDSPRPETFLHSLLARIIQLTCAAWCFNWKIKNHRISWSLSFTTFTSRTAHRPQSASIGHLDFHQWRHGRTPANECISPATRRMAIQLRVYHYLIRDCCRGKSNRGAHWAAAHVTEHAPHSIAPTEDEIAPQTPPSPPHPPSPLRVPYSLVKAVTQLLQSPVPLFGCSGRNRRPK